MTATTRTARGTLRQRKPRALDIAMRRDGWVTAAEVAGATGMTLGAVVAAIKRGAIPGKGVRNTATFGKRVRWYVDIRAYLDGCGTSAPSALRRELSRLKLVTGVK